MTKLFADGGDAACAPSHSLVALWAALAAGCEGLLVDVRRSVEGVWFCIPSGIMPDVVASAELSALDAGQSFRAEAREDYAPWSAKSESDKVRYPLLDEVLRTFGRRCELIVRPGMEAEPHLAELRSKLQRFGLNDPVVVTLAANAALEPHGLRILSAPLETRPRGIVFEDSLQAPTLDHANWAAGYSHANQETRLEPSTRGFAIKIERGEAYSGGAYVLKLPVPGDFDAQVDFWVAAPQQATTFELAAIALEPGYTQLDPSKLGPRDAHLSFDVHGAPPYASSERDEDDGFRFGWNSSSNLTRIGPAWEHDSANMYNHYSRDVGDGSAAPGGARGTLRLIRAGQVFASYFRAEPHKAWVCSGAGLVSTMPHDVFLRLAAKHWKKGGVPPANEVVFTSFQLLQP